MIRRPSGPIMEIAITRLPGDEVQLAYQRRDGRDAPGSGFALDLTPAQWAEHVAAVLAFEAERIEDQRDPARLPF